MEIALITLITIIIVMVGTILYIRLCNKKEDEHQLASPSPYGGYDDDVLPLVEHYEKYKKAEEKREKYERMKSIWQDSAEDDPVSRGKLMDIENELIAINVVYVRSRNVVIRQSKKLLDDGILPMVDDKSVHQIVFDHINEEEMPENDE